MVIPSIVIQIFVVLFAITVHEASHGWAAAKKGDFTAQSMGRVSLNPIVHIDPIGTLLLPIFMAIASQGRMTFGWAKPVPVNPYNLRHPRRDGLWISLAGPAANLITAAVFLPLILILKNLKPDITNFLYLFLTRSPLPTGFSPLDGLAIIFYFLILINTYFALFNLIPVPPLDGSGILSGLLSDRAAEKYDRIRPYGFIIVIALVYIGVLDVIVRPIQLLINMLIFS
jgi:Zn-dependent protease